MDTIDLYGIPNCDTVKKARAWLDAQGCAYRFHDFKKEGLDPDRLASWVDTVGWEALLNRAGTTFRKLGEDDRRDLDRSRALALMAAQPSMVKRPVLVCGETVMVGFAPDRYADRLAQARG